jgi:hypothetical protein
VGITGKRTLTEAQAASAGGRIETVLELARGALTRAAADPRAQTVYADVASPRLEFLSPMAEGADRLAAKVAQGCGFALHVPMPFEQSDYQQDFRADPKRSKPDTTGVFHLMLPPGNARIELDGGRTFAGDHGYDEARSYEAVGRYVVRNVDLLIAVWDGAPPGGWGGTADIIRFALETGTPVWWIHTDPTIAPKWLELPQEMHFSGRPQPAEEALGYWLERLVIPPLLERPEHRRSASEWIADAIRWVLRYGPPDPLMTYLGEPKPHPRARPWQWKAHAWLISKVARFRFEQREDRPPDDPIAALWFDLYQSADSRANEYGARYRSSYVWIFVLAAISLVCVASSLAFHNLRVAEDIALAGEALSLLVIVLLLGANIGRDWHQRWIDYRLLAELCRKQQSLAPLGWSLPGRAVETLADRADQPPQHDGAPHGDRDRTAWVAWLFAAYRRTAPLPSGRFSQELIHRCYQMVRHDLVAAQDDYHAGRSEQYNRAGQFLVLLGEGLFALVLLCVAAKLWLVAGRHEAEGWLTALSFVASVAPAIAAASIGIRAYAELEVLALQSEHMRMAMQRLGKRLDGLMGSANRPLVSQELGALTLEVATTMLQDIDGWARLFRVKVVEAG